VTELRSTRIVSFGDFEANLHTGELHKAGRRLRLSGQPMQILAILLERPGQLVSREELQKQLWPDTFVDVDHSLNAAVNRIREVLGDSAEKPQFIETLPRRGYRFISQVTKSSDRSETSSASNSLPGDSTGLQRTVLVALISLAVILVGGLVYRTSLSKAPRTQRSITRITFEQGLQTEATWSPDGQFIAYSSMRGGKPDIWVQHVGGGAAVQITRGLGNNWQPDWSPDGKYIAYRSEDGEGGIFVIPALGGDNLRRKLSSFGVYPRWSPDGKRIVFLSVGYSAVGRVFVEDADGSGQPSEVMPEVSKQTQSMSAMWHPDGKRITVWGWTLEPTALPKFWTGELYGTDVPIQTQIPADLAAMAKTLAGESMVSWADADFRFAWGEAGSALYFERSFRGAKNIWRMTIDPNSLRATGLERVTTGSENESDFALSADGTKIAFTSDTNKVQAWTFPFDAATGRITAPGESVTSEGMEAWQGSLSPDGTRIVFSTKRAGKWELWEKSLADGTELPLIADDAYLRNEPQWSPDGLRVVYVRQKRATGEQQIAVWNRSTRTEEPQSDPTRQFLVVFDWSLDGHALLVTEDNHQTGRSEIWREPAPGVKDRGLRKKLVSRPDCDFWQEKFSPDGKWIVVEAICDDPLGLRSAIYLVPSDGGTLIRVTDGKHWDDKPRWSPSGRSIYFVSDRNGYLNVFGVPVHGQQIGDVFQVTDFDDPVKHIPKLVPMVGLSVTGSRLMVTLSRRSGSLWVLDGVDR
jgi:Tol biopolymer transport system component/DNA-binding winged helix-turn-helix (wHTH) protein